MKAFNTSKAECYKARSSTNNVCNKLQSGDIYAECQKLSKQELDMLRRSYQELYLTCRNILIKRDTKELEHTIDGHDFQNAVNDLPDNSVMVVDYLEPDGTGAIEIMDYDRAESPLITVPGLKIAATRGNVDKYRLALELLQIHDDYLQKFIELSDKESAY